MAESNEKKQRLNLALIDLINSLYGEGVDVPRMLQKICEVIRLDREYNEALKEDGS